MVTFVSSWVICLVRFRLLVIWIVEDDWAAGGVAGAWGEIVWLTWQPAITLKNAITAMGWRIFFVCMGFCLKTQFFADFVGLSLVVGLFFFGFLGEFDVHPIAVVLVFEFFELFDVLG